MLEKEITYEDFLGNTRTEKFYFNLSKAEIMQLNFDADGNLKMMIEKITQAKDVKELAALFKKIILMAYGEVSPDGRHFWKNNGELAKEFEQTEAFSELYSTLATDDKAAADFINGIIPAKLLKEAQEAQKVNP